MSDNPYNPLSWPWIANLLRGRSAGPTDAQLAAQGLVRYPDGRIGTPGGGFGPPAPIMTAPINMPAVGGVTGVQPPVPAPPPAPVIPVGGLGAREGMVPLQAQSAAMPVSPALTQQFALGLGGAPATPTPPRTPTSQLAQQAAAYRAASTTEQLNAASLAAARAGRNFWNPALNVQPGGNVVNALMTPPGANVAPAAAQPWQSAAVQPVSQQPLAPLA